MITIEEAKKELREYVFNLRYIEEKQADALETRTKLESTTKRLSGMPSGKGPNLDRDVLAEGLDRMNEITKECDKGLQELLLKKYIVESKIEKLEQPYKSILFIRYVRGKRIGEVAEAIGLDYKYTCKMHGQALEEYAKVY